MNTTVFAAIISKLATDATLLTHLGGAFVFRARTTAPAQIPSITIFENNEPSKPRVGSASSRHRDANPTIQVDVWVSSADEAFPCTGEDADTIANRIDEVLLNTASPVTNTYGWEKTTSSQQHEDDTRIWHNALRYTFQYSMTDT